jgi:hypothetical protein
VQASQAVLMDLAVMMTTKLLPGSSNSLMLAIKGGQTWPYRAGLSASSLSQPSERGR